jgi:uncharacterized DUF497 family protein
MVLQGTRGRRKPLAFSCIVRTLYRCPVYGLNGTTGRTDRTGKHGIQFEEAETVFLDERALFMDDPDHSEDEDSGDVVRIISAHKADRSERMQYTRRNQP